MPYVVEDVISADIAEESSVKLADIERYAATTTPPPEEQQHLIFVVLLFVSGALNVIHLYSLIFSPRMKIDARRWHAIYCCLVNFMLLWCYANFTKNQPFYEFSPNIYWKSHADPIQMVPFSAFPASLCLLILISMVTFISKRLKSLFLFKWLLSLVFYVALIYAQYALVTSYYDSINEADMKIVNGHPILHFHYYTCMCAAFLWLILLVFAIFATLYYGVRAVTSRRKVAGNRLKDVYSLYGVLLYSTAVIWCHLPKESILLGRYMQEVFIPMHPQQLDMWKLGMISKISKSPVIPAFVEAIPITNGLIPAVEYLAGSICFTSFRESLVQLLSCGSFYPTSSEGSIWNICKRLNRIRTASATVTKKEDDSSVHVVVMDTKIKTELEIIT